MNTEIKKLLWAVIILGSLSILLGTAKVSAAQTCSNILSNADESSSENPLKALKTKIRNAKTLREADELTYELVVLGNIVFDQAIDGIIEINKELESDPEVVEQQVSQVQFFLEALQDAFKVPGYILNFAINNRLEIEKAELEKGLRAENRRRAIGFGRDESSRRFHSEHLVLQPPGFKMPIVNEEVEEKPVRIFYIPQEEYQIAKEVEEISKIPLGFIPPLEGNDDTEESSTQIGFIQATDSDETFTRDDVVQIVLNVQNGEFRTVLKEQN